MNTVHRHNDYVTIVVDYERFTGPVATAARMWLHATNELANVSSSKGLIVYDAPSDPIEASARALGDLVAKIDGNPFSVRITGFCRNKEDQFDYSVQFEYSRLPIARGRELRTTLLCAFRLASMKEQESKRRDDTIVSLLESFTSLGDVAGGLIELANCWESGFGRIHGTADLGYAPFQRRVSREIWLNRQNPYCPRGIFWANWLSPATVAAIERNGTQLGALCATSRCQLLDNRGAIIFLSESLDAFRFPFYSLPPTAIDVATKLELALRASKLELSGKR